MTYTSLISSTDLAKNIKSPDWRIIDCRFFLDNTSLGKRQYAESHLPNALYAHLDKDLSGPVVKGVTGRHPLPNIETFSKRLSDWGIDERVQVIVYDQGPGMIAARLWWMLRWLGHEKVGVLDGGWKKWQEENRAVSQEVKHFEPRQFIAREKNNLVATAEEVTACMHNPACKLLDVRSADRYRGENETMDPVAGHIPSAISAPFMANLADNGCFLSQHELRTLYHSLLGETESRDTIIYCGSGVTAAHSLLALLHAGLGDAKLYAGSWSHWITDRSRPVATGY